MRLRPGTPWHGVLVFAGVMQPQVCVQAVEELEAAAASGLQPLRYVGAPMPHWHQPLLLMHAVARSQWPQPLLGEAAAAALMAFAGACVDLLQAAPATATEDGGAPLCSCDLAACPVVAETLVSVICH